VVEGFCELHDLARRRGLGGAAYPGEHRPTQGIVSANPFIATNMDNCILCARCVRMCDEVQGDHALDIRTRGFQALVLTTYDRAPRDTDCVYCGQCVATCPTGALLDRKALNLPGSRPMRTQAARGAA
jgi:formate dehydrogenase alpha subunit